MGNLTNINMELKVPGGKITLVLIPVVEDGEYYRELEVLINWDKNSVVGKHKADVYLKGTLNNPIRFLYETDANLVMLYLENQKNLSDKSRREDLRTNLVNVAYTSGQLLVFNAHKKREKGKAILLRNLIEEVQFKPDASVDLMPYEYLKEQFLDLQNYIDRYDFEEALDSYLQLVNRFLSSNRLNAYKNLNRLIQFTFEDPIFLFYIATLKTKTKPYYFNYLQYRFLFENERSIQVPDNETEEISFIHQLLVYDNWIYRQYFLGPFPDSFDIDETEEVDFVENSRLVHYFADPDDDDLSGNEILKNVLEHYVRFPLMRLYYDLKAIKEDWFPSEPNIYIGENDGIIQIGDSNKANLDKQN